MSKEKKEVLKRFPTAEVHKQRKYEGKNVFWVTYPNYNFTVDNLIGVGTTKKEAWISALECIETNIF